MPLTNTQKILAWGSAGLMATASALGVMFYSPNVLGHSNIFALNQPTTKVFGKSKDNDPYANGGRLPNLPDHITNNLSITQDSNSDSNTDTKVNIVPNNVNNVINMGKRSTKTLSLAQDKKYDSDYVIQSDFHNLSSGLNYEGSPAHRTTPGLVGPGYDHGIGIYHGELEASNLQDKSSHNVIKVTLPQNPENKTISAFYPNSATLTNGTNKEKLDTVLSVNHLQYYYPWDGNSATSNNGHADDQNRSLVFSKDLYEGFMYNGLSGMHIQYQFFKAGTTTPVSVKGDYLEFRSINGLAPYKRHKSGGQDAWRNNENFAHDLYYDYSRNFDDTVGESVQSGSNYWNLGEYVMPKRYNSQIRNEYSPYSVNHKHGESKMATGGLYASKYHNRYDHDIVFKIPSDVASFNNGSSVGYGNVQPFTNIYNSPEKPFTCTFDSDGNIKTNLKVGDSATKSQLSNNGKYHMKPGDYNKIVNSDGYVTKDGLKYWEDNVAPCKSTTPTQTPHPTPNTPIKKYLMPNGFNSDTGVESGSNKIHTKPINASGTPTDEGYLKRPNQTYWYKITGTVPKYNVGSNDSNLYHTYETQTWNPNKPYNLESTYMHHDPIHTGDKYVFTDDLPSDVSIVNKDVVTKWGDKISHSDDAVPHLGTKNGKPQYSLTMKLGRSDGYHGSHNSLFDPNGPSDNVPNDNWGGSLVRRSGQKYTIYVKVKANHLPKLTKGSKYAKSGWQEFWNGDRYNGGTKALIRYHGHDNDISKTDRSNPVPVKIKKLKANIWHYDYNNDHHIGRSAFFPDDEQPFGLYGGTTKPYSKYYRNYRFNRFFNSDKGVLKHDYEYWYVGTNHDVNTLSKSRSFPTGSKQHVRYRFIYPSLKNDSESKHDTYYSNFGNVEKALRNQSSPFSSDYTKPDLQSNAQHHVVINANPDSGNYYSEKSDSFDQSNYLPYYIPRVSLDEQIKSDGTVDDSPDAPGAYRMVIDTDKKEHGLPFRLDTRAQDLLYGTRYSNDFRGIKVNTTISSQSDGKGRLFYADQRPLISNDLYHKDTNTPSDNSAFLRRYKYHHDSYNYSEAPSGDNSKYLGYKENNALGSNNESHNYDLHVNDSDYKPGTEIPVYVHFSIYDPHSDDDEIDMTDIKTHAYVSNNDQITSKKTPTNGSQDNNPQVGFGTKRIEGEDGSNKADYSDSGNEPSKDDSNNPNRATIISPERTIDYGNDPDGRNVRELKEQLSVTQPRQAVGKTGYGISANDFGLDYRGHLESGQYAKKGTNMQFAFPEVFNSHDSNIHYDKNNRPDSDKQYYPNGTLLADNLLHVHPSDNSGLYDNLDNYGESPVNLDTHKNNESVDQIDNQIDKSFNGENNLEDESLDPGNFTTTYGFYPRETNNEYDQGDKSNTDTNNGSVTVDSNNDPYPFNGTDSKGNTYGDSSNDSDHGLTTYNTHVDSDATKHTISTAGQNERMFTPLFLDSKTYPDVFHRAYHSNSSDDPSQRIHRLGGNFFDIDENRPIKLVGHQYISKNDRPRDQKYDELSLQPILTNPENGLMQTPISNPAFPNQFSNHNLNDSWLTDSLWSGMYGPHTALLR